MGIILSCNNSETSYSYQHLHGVMLINLNRLAFELNLSHTEYHLMGVLIGYWNKKQGKSFPTTRMLAKYCRMGNSTVLKSLKKLSDSGLLMILKDGKTKRQTYYLNTNKLLDEAVNLDSNIVTKFDSACSSNNKHNRKITNKKKTSSKSKTIIQKNDDVIFLSLSKKEVLTKLLSWKFFNARQIIKEIPEKYLLQLIKEVEKKAPDNPGAYFRTLLSIKPELNNFDKPETPINKMVKHKYWNHKPTGKKLQVLPDFGTHLLIKYFREEDMVMFLDSGFTDVLSAFEPVRS